MSGASIPFADPLAHLLKLLRRAAVIDVGANPHDGGTPIYEPLMKLGLCTVFGFEPHPEAFAALQNKKGPLETYLPVALGDGKEHTLYICRASGMTSLLRPDRRMLSQFPGFEEWGQIVDQVKVKTKPLDKVGEIGDCDFLKLDVQGGELLVLQNARRRLASAVALHLEVSFVTLYEKQPTFADIDQFLREQGFLPHMFANIDRRMILPMFVTNSLHTGLNQLLQADVVYVRDFTRMESMSDEQVKQLALIAHYCYKSYDLTYRCIFELGRREISDRSAGENYLKMVSAKRA
jgi:FkbM family methyltransferase